MSGAAESTMPKSLLDKYYQGVTYFKAGDLEKAIGEFRTVAYSLPEDPLIHISLAAALQQHGDIDDAIAEYNLRENWPMLSSNILRQSSYAPIRRCCGSIWA
jgi:Flp pilus assembly protein TadD